MLDGDHLRTDEAAFDTTPLQSDRTDALGAIVNGLDLSALDPGDTRRAPLRIGLIDFYRLSQECLVRVFADLQQRIVMVAFPTLQKCILDAPDNLDLILYYNHATGMLNMQDVSAIRRALPDHPIILLSDADDADQPHVIYGALKQGVRGFIPTRTMGIPMIVAAIRFVCAGGTYAPLDLLLSRNSQGASDTPANRSRNMLTSRELVVLGCVRQGKANKMIAYELGMKESTVKVHVRHIMRKTGSSNRVQAAYTTQNLWDVPPARD